MSSPTEAAVNVEEVSMRFTLEREKWRAFVWVQQWGFSSVSQRWSMFQIGWWFEAQIQHFLFAVAANTTFFRDRSLSTHALTHRHTSTDIRDLEKLNSCAPSSALSAGFAWVCIYCESVCVCAFVNISLWIFVCSRILSGCIEGLRWVIALFLCAASCGGLLSL